MCDRRMIYKRCPHCGKRIPEGTKCDCGFKRDYGKTIERKKKYHTNRWTQLTKVIKSMYVCDPYAYAHGRVEPCEIVHHIIPTDEDPDKFFDTDNLIPLSRTSHTYIHQLYDESKDIKTETQEELQKLVKHLA